MFYAEMETEHFTFRAIASYELEAKTAILRGWKKHAKEVAKTGFTSEALSWKTFDELDDYYGINVLEIEINNCFRDDTDLKTK